MNEEKNLHELSGRGMMQAVSLILFAAAVARFYLGNLFVTFG